MPDRELLSVAECDAYIEWRTAMHEAVEKYGPAWEWWPRYINAVRVLRRVAMGSRPTEQAVRESAAQPAKQEEA